MSKKETKVLQSFYFPKENKTIKATSQEEAEKILKTNK